MTMKVLILGGSGHIGKHLANILSTTSQHEIICASRRAGPTISSSIRNIALDTRNEVALSNALSDVDCVVNCVAGGASSIADGARALVSAALQSNCRRIVHLSTMSVYGRAEGVVTESTALDPDLGWYAKAKCEAESHMDNFVAKGGSAVILRPGCVYGPGSELWVGRIGRLLLSRRLGDLGMQGDGWSNLIHVDDVCKSVLASLQLPLAVMNEPLRFNLAAPDSPRWNEYFVDLSMAVGTLQVPRVTRRKLLVESYVRAPLTKILEKIGEKLRIKSPPPNTLTPNLLHLFEQQISLDTSRAISELRLECLPYQIGLMDSAVWFNRQQSMPI